MAATTKKMGRLEKEAAKTAKAEKGRKRGFVIGAGSRDISKKYAVPFSLASRRLYPASPRVGRKTAPAATSTH